MTSRSSLLMLAVGLLVGASAGYMAGRRPAVPAAPAPTAIAPPPSPMPSAPPPDSLTLSPTVTTLNDVLDTKPAGVSKGMSRTEATTALKARGFEAWADATASDQWERFRKPWHGGYHFVNLRFGGEEIAEVGEVWNDP